MIERNLIPADAGDFLAYDPHDGKLTWKVAFDPRITVGEEAGYVHPRGYRHVYIRRRSYKAHRIAWFLMTGVQPPDVIDHKDGDAANNAWANLRGATDSLNGANRHQQSAKLKGTQCFRGRWRAVIGVKKRKIYLGVFDSETAAHAAYLAAAKHHFGEFARSA